MGASEHVERFQKCDIARYHTCSQIWTTHLSEDTLLCLRPSHSAVMPSVVNVPKPLRSTPQSWLLSKLPETNNERFQKCDIAQYHTCSESWHTHLSEDTLLCLRASQSAVMPSVVNVPSPY